MITRRSLFASLAGLAVAPIVAKEVVIGVDFGTAPAVVAYESDNWYLVSYEARSNLSRSQRDKGHQS